MLARPKKNKHTRTAYVLINATTTVVTNIINGYVFRSLLPTSDLWPNQLRATISAWTSSPPRPNPRIWLPLPSTKAKPFCFRETLFYTFNFYKIQYYYVLFSERTLQQFYTKFGKFTNVVSYCCRPSLLSTVSLMSTGSQFFLPTPTSRRYISILAPESWLVELHLLSE